MSGHSGKRTKPFYPLRTVRELASQNRCEINSKARYTANRDFGWKRAEIIKAIQKLKLIDYYKTDPKYDNPTIMVDYYKSINLLGEEVYMHFRLEERGDGKWLVICSLKRLQQ